LSVDSNLENLNDYPIQVIRSHLYIVYLEERIKKSKVKGLSKTSVKQIMSKSKKWLLQWLLQR